MRGMTNPFAIPTSMITGAISTAITMYVAVVGNPIPRRRLATAVIVTNKKIFPPFFTGNFLLGKTPL